VKSVPNVVDCRFDYVHLIGSGHVDVRREPLQCVRVDRGFGFPVPDGVTPVVFHGWAEVPGVVPTSGPRSALIGFLVHYNVSAGWSDGIGIEVIVSMELGVRRELGVKARAAEEVECKEGLREQFVP